MAELTAEQKRTIANRFVKQFYKVLGNTATLDTDDIIAAIQPTEDFIIDDRASYNAVLPEPFKSTAALQEKTLLFCYVAMKQAGLI